MKRFVFIVLTITLLFAGCTSDVVIDEKTVFSWGGKESYSDSGVFYSKSSTISGGDVIYRYSTDTGLSIPLCNKPDCTHNIESSPNCNALANQPISIFSANGKLYFMELNKETTDLNVICADINGGNRKKIAAIEYGAMGAGFIDRIRYCDGKLIYTSYDMFDAEFMDSANDVKKLDKYIATVRSVDIANGEIRVLVKRQDYNARISNAVVYNDTLIYFYSYNTELPSGNSYTEEEWQDTYRYGVFSVDLNSGEEICLTKDYDRMTLASDSFNCFSYYHLIFFSTDTDMLYKYDWENGTFASLSKCENINMWYIADDKSALFLENEDDCYFKRYDFESGVFTEVSRDGFIPLYLNGEISGEKVWFSYTDENGKYCMGYMNRDDLMNGKYDDFKFAYFINEEA